MSGVTVMSGLLILTAGVFLHVGLLRATRSNDGWIDLKIYRQTGELVASRINPYDQAQMSSSSLIQGIRTRDDLYDPWASSPENFDYYVTSNLPGSTLFYGALAWKGNSPPHGSLLCASCGISDLERIQTPDGRPNSCQRKCRRNDDVLLLQVRLA